MMKTTSLEYQEHGETHRITVKYGLDYGFAKKNNQAPFFSLTADIKRRARNGRWVDESGGACHEEIVKHFPQLQPLVQWHMVSTEQPLHYLANAKYWWERLNGISQFKVESYEDPAKFPDHFKGTIVWGSIPNDTEPELINLMTTRDWSLVEDVMKLRLPRVMAKFFETMKALDVLEELVPVSA